MAVRRIRLLGDPVLRTKCRPVCDPARSDVRRTIRDLDDTLKHFRTTHGFGRGIAAPQIGKRGRIVFLRAPEPLALINPRIVARSVRKMVLWDDCFSLPDILVRLRRDASITVKYLDASGVRQVLRARGRLSELIQHEIDHLDGVLMIDRAISKRGIILRSERNERGRRLHPSKQRR